MSSTLSELCTYLELLDLPKALVKRVLKREDILLYGLMRDRLTHVERIELQAILNQIYYEDLPADQVDFSKYVNLDRKEKEVISKVFGTSPIAISSMIQMEPKDVAFNIAQTLL